jgi:L-2-hydroxyglutarate oxidase
MRLAMCIAGARSMAEYAQHHGVRYERTGKLVVAQSADEVPRMMALYERALAGGIPVKVLSREQAREIEPNVECAGAIQVASTGIVDYVGVCKALAAELTAGGTQLRLGAAVVGLRADSQQTMVLTAEDAYPADVVVNCGGLQSDRIASLDASPPPLDEVYTKIAPFRGEFYQLRAERADLVRTLIYPVPDPKLPFLGVHLIKGVDGRIHAGPNAVLALAREGYTWRTVRRRDLAELLRYPGFWRFARRHVRPGMSEVARSLSARRFLRSVQQLVPSITADDLERAKSGVRAQALTVDGTLLDDFAISVRGRNVHVLNAPSPAATCALEIGSYVAARATAIA